MKVKVDVRQVDINEGKLGDHCYCAVALAVKNTPYFKGCQIYVTDTTINWYEMYKHGHFKMSSYITRWIRKFDIDKNVTPISFEVEVP